MASPHIQRNLNRLFHKHRVVFWYDEDGGWKDEALGSGLEDIEVKEVASNELALKFEVLLDRPSQKFLLYSPSPRPADEHNWLLDILLSNAEFHADRASLNLQEVDLPPEYRDLAEQHAAFFNRKERRDALKAQLKENPTHRAIRRHMMAILCQAADPSLDSILLSLCESLSGGGELLDPVRDVFEDCDLVAAFWRELEMQFGYASDAPSLLDFIISVFLISTGLDSEKKNVRASEAMVFISRWKDSSRARKSFERLSATLAKDLDVKGLLGGLSDRERDQLVENETDNFEVIEHFLLSWFRDAVQDRKWSGEKRRHFVEKRSRSFWYHQHEPLYQALNHAGELLDLVETVDFEASHLDQAIRRYREGWWKIDHHYRRFDGYRRKVRQQEMLGELADLVEIRYLNDYLAPLATRWESLLNGTEKWPPAPHPRARDFFRNRIVPGTKDQKKIFVIISDGFRYECAMDLRQRFMREDRFSAEVDTQLAPLPSYTQLGMAALLPNEKLSISEDCKTAFVDGNQTVGLQAREAVLKSSGLRAKAMNSEEFLNLNTKTQGRPLMKDHDVVFIYHNQIDKLGDDLKTEAQTATACESAIQEIFQIVKKATNINASNILVTADHGFLYQHSPVEDIDSVDAPKNGLLGKPHRRFVVGENLKEDSTLRAFAATDLGLENDFDVGIVKGVQRLKVRGAGKRYIHGGAMPQEVIVPVVSINKARVSDVKRVEVEIQSLPSKITTMTVVARLFQKQPVSEEDKLLGRELEVGIFDPQGKLISNLKTIDFNSGDSEPRNREEVVNLILEHRVTEFNNQILELRLLEKIGGTSHSQVYASANAKFIEPFESEIDEF